MTNFKPTNEFLQIRSVGLIPEALERKPEFPDELALATSAALGFTHLIGRRGNTSYLVEATEENALRVAGYGNDYRNLTTVSGTAPATFDTTARILRTAMTPKWDFLIESQEALIRFILMDGSNSDEIPLPVGFRSVEFSALGVQIKKRNATAGTYHITAYYA